MTNELSLETLDQVSGGITTVDYIRAIRHEEMTHRITVAQGNKDIALFIAERKLNDTVTTFVSNTFRF